MPPALRMAGIAAALALPSAAVVAAEASPAAAPEASIRSAKVTTPKLTRISAHLATDGDGDSTNFGAQREASLLRWAKAVTAARQAAFFRGLLAASHRPHYALPDTGPLTQPYGGPGGHPGIDLAGPDGSPVLAAAAGTVVFSGQDAGYGNFIEVRGTDGTYTAYGHLMSLLASVGQRVRAGQRIGLEGSTGDSTGPHLHFEVRLGLNGPTTDPLAWLTARGVRLAH